MIDNIVYHTVIVVFVAFLCVSLFHLKQTLTCVQTEILPFFLKETLILPQDRSLLFRALKAIERELSKKLHVSVKIHLSHEQTFYQTREFKYFLELLLLQKNLNALKNDTLKQHARKIEFKYRHDYWEVLFS